MRRRALLERIDGHMERIDGHMERQTELMGEIREEVRLSREEIRLSREERRLTRESTRELFDSLREFMREITARVERVGREQVAEMRDLRAESRAQREALLRLIDRMDRLDPGSTAA